MQLGCNTRDFDGGELLTGRRLNMNISTCMEVRRDLDRGEMRIYGPGWRLDSTLK